METVCADAAPAERQPIDTDPGGSDRRAFPLSSSAPTRLGILYKHGRSCILVGMFRFALHCLGCVSGCVHTLVKPSSGQASQREVYPPGPSLMVLGACG